MNAGLLRHLITIEKPARTQNEFGESVLSWSTLLTCWASIDVTEAKERSDQARPEQVRGFELHVRYDKRIKSDQRIRHKGRILQIDSVENLWERDVELVLKCFEVE